MEWISVKDRLPYAWESGDWDGLKTDLVLTFNDKGFAHVGLMYEGTMDGFKFNDWHNLADYEIKGVTHWAEIEPPKD